MNRWKASVLMMGITPESVAAVLQSVELRSAWDPFIHSYKLLQKVNEAPHQVSTSRHPVLPVLPPDTLCIVPVLQYQ